MKLESILTVLALMVMTVPLRAQEIMSYEEYQRLKHEEPYILKLCAPAGRGALLYFGSRHSNDPSDPQMERIEQAFHAFAPDLVLTEGGNLEMDGLTRADAIHRFGEFGLTRWLARSRGTPSENLDPAREAEIGYLREKAGFTVPQLKLFYTLRQVSQSHRTQSRDDFDHAVPKYLQHLSKARGLPGPPETLSEFEAEVRRLLPNVDNWRQIAANLFYPGPQNPQQFTNEIQTASNNFRDRHQLRRIINLIHSGHRVFAIVGSTHVVMQEPALRKQLGMTDCT